MSARSARAAAVVASIAATAAVSLLAPASALGHAIGEVFTLPVPLGLYLAGAAFVVAASFVVSVVIVRPAGRVPGYPARPVSGGVARVASLVLRLLGVVWWYGAIVAGFLVDPASPLPAVLFWIGVWVGLPLASVFGGNSWPSLSPFRATFGALEWLAQRTGMDRVDFGIAYPVRLGRWPAVAFLFAAL